MKVIVRKKQSTLPEYFHVFIDYSDDNVSSLIVKDNPYLRLSGLIGFFLQYNLDFEIINVHRDFISSYFELNDCLIFD